MTQMLQFIAEHIKIGIDFMNAKKYGFVLEQEKKPGIFTFTF